MNPSKIKGMAHGEYEISSPFVKIIIPVFSLFFLILDVKVTGSIFTDNYYTHYFT